MVLNVFMGADSRQSAFGDWKKGKLPFNPVTYMPAAVPNVAPFHHGACKRGEIEAIRALSPC
ncbi:hypothetical protein GCM10023067_46820 [Aminobacter aganoensis]